MGFWSTVRRHSLHHSEEKTKLKEAKKEKKEKEKKEKEEKRKSKNGIVPAMDPDHPPGARDVGFRKSFAITGDGKDHGGDQSGRNSPTTMANTAANKTLGAMKAGDNLEVPKGGQGKMQTLDQYGGVNESVSPRTQTIDSVRKISEDLDLTASGSPPAASAIKPSDLGPIDESNHNAAKEALDPNFSTTSDPDQTHILPLQNREFLTSTDTHSPAHPATTRPGVPLEKQHTNISSVYDNSTLTPATTNLSDAHIPLEKTNTRDSYYTQDTDDEFSSLPDHSNSLKPRPMTLQQEYSELVDLPLTPLPTNTQLGEPEPPAENNQEEENEEEKDESDVVTPRVGQGEFSNAILKTPEEEKDFDPNAPSKPGDFLAAIQNTFPDAAPNTAPVPVSLKDIAASSDNAGGDRDKVKPQEYQKHVSSTDGYTSTKDGHPATAADAKAAPEYSHTDEASPLSSEDETILAQYKTLPSPPDLETDADAKPRTVVSSQDVHRPKLSERDTEDLIRQTPGGFISTPTNEHLPETANEA